MRVFSVLDDGTSYMWAGIVLVSDGHLCTAGLSLRYEVYVFSNSEL